MKTTILTLSLALLCATLTACAAAPRKVTAAAPPPSAADTTAVIPELADVSFAELERRVAQGDIKAHVELGARYGRGRGVEKNYDKAIALLKFAAEHNDPVGEYLLGTAYYSGAGVPKDESTAALLFERSADQHYAVAAAWMGFMITNGRGGISASSAGAIPYLWDAATQGDSMACLLLGYAYDKGNDVDRNPRAAAYWYRRAFANQRNPQAEINVLTLIQHGEIAWQPGDPGQPPAAPAPESPAPASRSGS